MTRGLHLTIAGLLGAAVLASGQEAPFRYETRKVDPDAAERGRVVAGALGVAAWPRTAELYVLPPVSRTLLRDPALVTEEVRACTTVPFDGEAWPQCTWSWKSAAGGRERTGDGWLDLQVTQAPSSRAAQEFLVASLADNMLPIEALEARYKAARRPENLGTVGFQVQSPKSDDISVSFIRGNLVLHVRAHGTLVGEAAPLASRLDESVLNQQPLTSEELRARKAKAN
jgi:hypothetical protein